MRVLACPDCGTRVGVPEGAAPYCPKCGFGREEPAAPPAQEAATGGDGSAAAQPATSEPVRAATPASTRGADAVAPASRAAPTPRRAARPRAPRRKGKGLVLADPYEDVEDGKGFAVAVGVAVGAGVLAVVGAYYFWVLV